MSINRFPSSSSSNNSSHSKARFSLCALVAPLFAKRSSSAPNQPLDNNHNAAATIAASTSSNNNNNNYDRGGAPAPHPNINMIRQDLIFMKELMAYVGEQLNKASEKFEELETRGGEREVEELKKKVWKLKSQIVSKLKIRSAYSNPHQNTGSDDESANSSNQLGDGLIHKLYGDPRFEEIAFERIKESFNRLPFKLKLCLLCFLNFPENAIIKKRCMIYWWIGVGILPPSIMQERTAEDFGSVFFDELIAKGFIEAFNKKGNLFFDTCRMQPLIRSALIPLADSVGYNLVRSASTTLADSVGFNLDEFQCWLNVGDTVIDDSCKLFSKMKRIKILYLGRWQSETKHHIEVENTKIFDGLKNMVGLTFLCLRGISLITELPEFVSQLSNLKILDLRACYNLEVVPEWIGSLESLTHLDMSECYYLDCMPEGLASLSQLQVLKGFVIGYSKGKKSCTLEALAKLSKLRKLNIYTTETEFPTEEHLGVLQKEFKSLRKLTITWGGNSLIGVSTTDTGNKQANDTVEESNPGIEGQGNNNEAEPTPEATAAIQPGASQRKRDYSSSELFPLHLEKLDLRGFPGKITPSWLRPANLKHLEKLYLRGGQLCDLEEEEEGIAAEQHGGEQWKVEIMRFKYLKEFEVDWDKLTRLFPKLKFLEMVECPKLSSFPCDRNNGVWMNSQWS